MMKAPRSITGAAAALATAAMLAPSAATADEPDLQPDVGPKGWTYRLATTWDKADHSGLAYDWKGARVCSAIHNPADYEENNFAEEALNQKITSLADFNQCDTQLWEGISHTIARSGGLDGWFDAGTSGSYVLDDWNNRARSAKWS